MMPFLSIACWIIVSTGCSLTKKEMLILPADKVIVPLAAGSVYTNALPGYFVPKARMLDILNQLSEQDVFNSQPSE